MSLGDTEVSLLFSQDACFRHVTPTTSNSQELPMSNVDALAALLEQVGAGDMIGARSHYHDDVIMHDPHAGTVEGKAANRAREEAFVAMIGSVEAFEVGPLLSGGDQTAYQNRFATIKTVSRWICFRLPCKPGRMGKLSRSVSQPRSNRE